MKSYTFNLVLQPSPEAIDPLDKALHFLEWLSDLRPMVGDAQDGRLYVMFDLEGESEDTPYTLLKTAVGRLTLAATTAGEELPSISEVSAIPTEVILAQDDPEMLEAFEVDLTDYYIQLQLNPEIDGE